MPLDNPSIIEKPKVDISPDILSELETMIYEQGQVVVHCIQTTEYPSYIRIWPTTYLYDHHSAHTSELVHAENITMFPVWKPVGAGENHFTLIFSGLPMSCLVFDLMEQCDNQAGAFKVSGILRNDSDVYFVEI